MSKFWFQVIFEQENVRMRRDVCAVHQGVHDYDEVPIRSGQVSAGKIADTPSENE